MTEQKHGFATRAIHDGQSPDPLTGAVNVPIYLSSTYAQEEIGKHKGYEYSRVSNPTRDALEKNLASLEGGTSAHVFASGMAAIMAMITMFRSGDHVICGENVYGGTPRLFNQIVTRYGIEFSYVDTSDPENVRRAIRPNTKIVHIETPTNPIMTLTDIRAVADVCHEKGVELAVDNTFMSPYFQQPIRLGADMVMHSTTKYLNGHSDVVGGAVIAATAELQDNLAWWANAIGVTGAPFDSFMTLRGVRTLHARMRVHAENTAKVVEFLAAHPGVARVYYPGLPDHPGHEIARRQQSGFGAMVSFELSGGEAAVEAFLGGLQCFTLAESLGGVESLISHPATMTHAGMEEAARVRAGIGAGLLRVSVGIEDAGDLLADLSAGLERAARVQPAPHLRRHAS